MNCDFFLADLIIHLLPERIYLIMKDLEFQ